MYYIAIVGRPNVGKSTLFNRIVGGRPAIVDDEPGVTRDRNIAPATHEEKQFGVIDSGGFDPAKDDLMVSLIREQAMLAIEEADEIFFVVDGRESLTATDHEIAAILRRSGKPVRLVVNKVDNPAAFHDPGEYARLGFESVHPVSAEHGLGVEELLDIALAQFPAIPEETAEEAEAPERPVRVAVVGKPNAGKSSLINRLLGEPRMMVSPIAGTTRDAVDTELVREGTRYILVDTAGIRRKARVSSRIEKFSVIMAMKAIERADVALLIIDAVEGVGAQEMAIGAMITGANRAAALIVTKWDLVEKETMTSVECERDLREKLPFLAHAPVLFISSLTGQRAVKTLDLVDALYAEYRARIPSGQLNNLIKGPLTRRSPPLYRGRRVKIYYVTQASVAPPTFVFMTNIPEGVPPEYRRYVANQLRASSGLAHAPLKLVFRAPPGRRRRGRPAKR